MKTYIRNCPHCGKEITYKTNAALQKAANKNTRCVKCNNSGSNNPFYGKTHTIVVINKIKENNEKNIDKFKSEEFKKKMSDVTSGNKNGMYGKSVYSVWVEKYGIVIADQKMKEYKLKQSINSSGNKNPMYGKPSPNGSGNGWSGWYKNYFFKSLKELSFILTLEKENIKYESAEVKKFKIEYINWEGKKRNYYPDFFLPENNTIIECKPTHLFNSVNVLCKQKYAKEFCDNKGYSYQIIDPVRIKDNIILELHNNGLLKFIDRYERKFKEKYIFP